MTYMPFGKHSGKEISDLPTGYLKWLLTIDLDLWLEEAVKEELELRQQGFQRGPKQTPAAPIDVAAWYRTLSLRFHPDRGGSKEAMQAIHVAKELLEEMLR